jgi:hypothetical protein
MTFMRMFAVPGYTGDLVAVFIFPRPRNAVILKTAVDSQRARQALDPLRFSTAAHFTKWVPTAVAPNTCG